MAGDEALRRAQGADPQAQGADPEAQRADPPWAAQQARAGDSAAAIVVMRRGVAHRLSFAGLEDRIATAAARLQDAGVRPGHRVALLVPPGLDLSVAVYACWRAGAVIVVADAGTGAARPVRRAARGRTRPRDRQPTHAGRGPAGPADRPPDPGWRAASGWAHGPTGAARPGRRGGRAVHLRGDRSGEGCRLHPGPAGRSDRPGPLHVWADPRRTSWSRPSPRSRSTDRPSASARWCRRWRSPPPAP